MKLFVDFAEVLVGDVGVDLGGTDAAVAEHRLDAADISSVHQQVGSETVPHGVRTDLFGNAGKVSTFINCPLDATGCQPTVIAAGTGDIITAIA